MITVKAAMRNADRMLQIVNATRDQLRLAKRAAINSTIKGMRLDAGRMIRETIQVTKNPQSSKTPKKIIESRIKLFFSDPKAMSDTVPGGKLVIKDIKIPIAWFAPRQTPKPREASEGEGKKTKRRRQKSITTAKVMRGGSRVIYPRGFGPNVKKLGYTIWERTGKARKPLKSIEGINAAEIIEKIGGKQRLEQMAYVRLDKAIKRRIERIKYVKERKKK